MPGFECVGYDFKEDGEFCTLYFALGLGLRKLRNDRELSGMFLEQLCTKKYTKGKLCTYQGKVNMGRITL